MMRTLRPEAPSAGGGFACGGGGGGGVGGELRRVEPRLIAGMLPPLLTGGLICALVLAEGVFLLLKEPFGDVGHSGDARESRMFTIVDAKALFLEVLTIGDIAAAACGLIGLAFASLRAPPAAALVRALAPSPRAIVRLAAAAPAVTTTGVGALLVWRSSAAIAVVPWPGYALLFGPPEYSKTAHFFIALAYTIASCYIAVLLFSVLGAASRSAKEVEEEFLLQAAEGSAQMLLRGQGELSDEEEEETSFGVFPLEPAVAAYAVCVGVISMWLMAGLIFTGRTGAGWAFLGKPGQQRSTTFWIEAIMYCLSSAAAALAASAVLARRRALRGGLEDSVVLRKRCAGLMLVFLAASAVRFSLSVPVTGMALAAEDLCGLYVYALSLVALGGGDRSISGHGAGVAPGVHCTATEWYLIAAMLLIIFLDAYLIVCTLKLWSKYRSSCTTSGTAGGGRGDEDAPLFGRKA